MIYMGNDDIETLDNYREITKKQVLRISELEKRNQELEELLSYYRGQMRTSTPETKLSQAIQAGWGPKTVESMVDEWT